MFNEILITLDGSEYSERALALGRDLAQLAGAHVALLTVIATASSPLEPVDEDAAEGRRRRALAYLDEQAQTLRSAGLTGVTTAVRAGQPSLAIAELARETHADLIVMSTQGLGADGQYGLGSVAMKVLMTAPCPVFMVRINRPEPPKDSAEERWAGEGGANVG